MSALPTRTDVSGTPNNATAKAAITAMYDMVAQRLAAGTSGAGTASEAELLLARASLGISQPQMRNLWRNSDGFINQRSTATSVADAAYGLFDRTYCLHESGNVTLARLNQPTDGIPYAMRLTQPDVSAKRIGFAQAMEAADCLAYRGSQLVFAPKLRLSVSANVRVALLAWTGTADTITRDVVNNWASGTYTAGNFFLASNVSVIAVGSAALTANTWADVAVSSASAGGVVAPSGMNNLIMMVWTEGTVAQNVTLDASCIRAGLGTQMPIWTPPSVQQELAHAQRYYATGGVSHSNKYTNQSGTFDAGAIVFPVTMRAAPTVAFSGVTYSNCSTLAAADVSAGRAMLTVQTAAATVYAVTAGTYTATIEL